MSENLLAGAKPPAEPAAVPAPGTPSAVPPAAAPPATADQQQAAPADPAKPDPAKPADAKPVDGPPAKPADGKDGDKPPGAPDAYEPFKVPDGLEADETKLAEFGAFARELGLSQDAAQKLMDRYGDVVGAPLKAWQDMQAAWVGEVKADKEIGGANLERSLGHASKALEMFGGAALKEALNVTGAGNHPAVVKAFVMIGKAIAEDGFVGGGAAAKPQSLADALYPTMRKE